MSTGVITNTIYDHRKYLCSFKLQEIEKNKIYISGSKHIGRYFSIIDILTRKNISSNNQFSHSALLTGAYPYLCKRRKKLFSGSYEGYIYEYDMIMIEEKISFKETCRYRVHLEGIMYFVCIKDDIFLTIGRKNDLRITNWKDKKIIAHFPTKCLEPFIYLFK